MAEVLVLVDHVEGKVRKTTAELLTIARRLGEPSAVFVGTGFDAAKETLARFGAEKVYRVESPEVLEHLVVPQAELLAQLVADKAPAAVLMPVHAGGQGDRRPARRQDRVGPDHRRRRRPGRPTAASRRRSRSSPARTPCRRRSPRARRSSPSSPTRPRPRRPPARPPTRSSTSPRPTPPRAPKSPSPSPSRPPAAPS